MGTQEKTEVTGVRVLRKSRAPQPTRVPAWSMPMDRAACRAAVRGSHRVRHGEQLSRGSLRWDSGLATLPPGWKLQVWVFFVVCLFILKMDGHKQKFHKQNHCFLMSNGFY